jgi:hypothetical protein
MERRRLYFVALFVMAVGTIVWSLIGGGKPPVFISVVGYESAERFGTKTHVCAIVGVTNISRRNVTYPHNGAPAYGVLLEVPRG